MNTLNKDYVNYTPKEKHLTLSEAFKQLLTALDDFMCDRY